MSTEQTIAVLDFGSQYTQLIARRVRENHVHSVLVRPDVSVAELRALGVVGVILSGGPASVYAEAAPTCSRDILDAGWPVLGVCYGMQLACLLLGGQVDDAEAHEYGRAQLEVLSSDPLLAHLPPSTPVWMSHGDIVRRPPEDFEVIGATSNCPCAVVRHRHLRLWGLQFHPEVTHTPDGSKILRNFLYDICGCTGSWQVGDLKGRLVADLRERVGRDERVICGLSGGVDSSVAATLLQEAIGDRLVCIFVDNGLLRQRERELVESTFRDHFHIDVRVVDASGRFLEALAGVADPQDKRRIIGHEFVEVFRHEARTIANARYLAQGTLYPDVIESGHGAAGTSANIKIHHNVGGLPAELGFDLIEPLRDLFKDEVRLLGEHLGLPEDIVWRHPFPGPGLAVRMAGAVTRERLTVLRAVDAIVLEEIRAAGWYRKIAQALAVLLPVQAVGVAGDKRRYEGSAVAVVRLVESEDFMTADWVRIDPEVLSRISNRVMNEVSGINRVLYDISSKPPATIEWE